LKLVIFCHPEFLTSQSMPRFARMLKSCYEARGHEVTLWSPAAKCHRWFAASKHAKWAGYVDQYLLFPIYVRKALKSASTETLFVFCDQALGPWMPLVKSRPHVVHVHDLLALRSALGDIKENPTSFTGRVYQRYIRWGFRHARHFISASKKTRDDLQRFGGVAAQTSDVVYNGLNFPYEPMPRQEAVTVLRDAGYQVPPDGILIHVGGNQWYKNLAGVLSIYSHYAARENDPLPLWCVSPPPTGVSKTQLSNVPRNGRVVFLQHLTSHALQAAYSYARAFLFPSLAEGFGWPLIEAQACGCPVITTNEPPMSEVAGDAAFYLPRLQYGEDIDIWGAHGAAVLKKMLSESAENRMLRSERGRTWAKTFDADRAIDAYLAIYHKILDPESGRSASGLVLDQGAQP
jgi:glycosyltransferase involved in cell wall biosynthesis